MIRKRLHAIAPRVCKSWLLVIGLLPGVAANSFGQSARLPLPIEQHEAVRDQFQQPLSGQGHYLVHVLSAGNQIHPPDPDTGTPHPSNAVLFTTRIGAGIRSASAAGGFVASLIPRPVQPFFVRVYNAPAEGDATFYEDSAPYYPNDTLDAGFAPLLKATTNPVDPSISVDGLTVSMKRSLGLDPGTADTDGDGYADLDELAMGTSAVDATDCVPPLEVVVNPGGIVSAGWAGGSLLHQHVLDSLGIPPHTADRLNQLFLDKSYNLQSSASPNATWVPAAQGQIGRAGWPPNISMQDATNRTGIFRLVVHP